MTTESAGIGAMLVSSRSLAEYRGMFALTDGDLRRRILDCPGGASSFTADVGAAGGDATACDVLYGETDADTFAARAQSENERGNRYVREHPDEYRWTFFADPDEHLRTRQAAARRFTADLRARPERYVAGRLPQLPFSDAAFDLVLSSHLLFSYADRLDGAFHRAALHELLRVGREVRIFPLVASGRATTDRTLDDLLAALPADGVRAQVVDVPYELQAGGHQMLVCRCAADTLRRASSGSPFEPTIGFSRAVRTGNRVLVSGTGPVWPDGSCAADAGTQARRCFEIVAAALAELGAGVDDVVRTRMFLTDPAAVDAVSAAHGELFGRRRPAATMVVVAALVDPRWLVEVEVEAELPG